MYITQKQKIIIDLTKAIIKGNHEEVGALLKEHDFLSAGVYGTLSPLYVAICLKQEKVLKKMLEIVPTLASKPSNGMIAVNSKLVAAMGKEEQPDNVLNDSIINAIKYDIEGVNNSRNDYNLLSAVNEDITIDDVNILKILLDHGLDIDARESQYLGWSFLHECITGAHGLTPLVEWLVKESGADVNFRDAYDSTPLHIAAYEGNLAIVEFLIANGADVSSKTVFGRTALHDAALQGRLETVEFLIKNGADINAKTNNSRTPLNLVIHESHSLTPELVELLIKLGADVSLQDDYGNTPLSGAKAKDKLEIVKLLEAAEKDFSSHADESVSTYTSAPLELVDNEAEQNDATVVGVDSNLQADLF